MAFIESCPLCFPTPHTLLWQDAVCRIVLLNDVDYPGYCRVELLAHVKEMTDLATAERAHIMAAVFATEQAIRTVLQADKINLASLGNKTPHVHWHVIPRFVQDKHFPNSHWGEATHATEPVTLSSAQIAQLKSQIMALMK